MYMNGMSFVFFFNVVCVCMLCVVGGSVSIPLAAVKREPPWFHVMLITSMIYALNRTWLQNSWSILLSVLFACFCSTNLFFFIISLDFSVYFVAQPILYFEKYQLKNLCHLLFETFQQTLKSLDAHHFISNFSFTLFTQYLKKKRTKKFYINLLTLNISSASELIEWEWIVLCGVAYNHSKIFFYLTINRHLHFRFFAP